MSRQVVSRKYWKREANVEPVSKGPPQVGAGSWLRVVGPFAKTCPAARAAHHQPRPRRAATLYQQGPLAGARLEAAGQVDAFGLRVCVFHTFGLRFPPRRCSGQAGGHDHGRAGGHRKRSAPSRAWAPDDATRFSWGLLALR